MGAKEWIAACTTRLQAQWPHVDPDELQAVAAELWAQDRWRGLAPAQAAEQWLRLGVLAGH